MSPVAHDAKPLRRRAKPLLGCLVEISIPADSEAGLLRATDAAFARIADFHRSMSFHEPDSDLRGLARCRAGEVLEVSADTWRTLELALQIEAASGGAFNPAVAPALVLRGLLPKPDRAQLALARTLAQGIELLDSQRVRVLSPVWIDLGGIAKGAAVDAAVQALLNAGVDQGVVNAGGDLRVFGACEHRLAMRVPVAPQQSVEVAQLRDLSCATSAGYFLDPAHPTGDHPGIIGRRADAAAFASVSVIAPTCVLADALTKVVWQHGGAAAPLLARYDARAVLMQASGHWQAL